MSDIKKVQLSEKLNALEGFSEETLNEMAMEAVEGGEDVNILNCGCNPKCTNYC